MRTKIIAVVTASLFSLLLMTGCQSVTNRDVGMATGAVLGGVLGAQVGKGRGRTAAIIVGTLAGAYIGGAIGNSMDQNDRYRANQSLNNYPDHQSSSWTNPNTGNQYTVTPTSTYNSNSLSQAET